MLNAEKNINVNSAWPAGWQVDGKGFFLTGLLSLMAKRFNSDSVSVYEFDARNSMLKIKLRLAHSMIFESEENIFIGGIAKLEKAVVERRIFYCRDPGMHFLYVPLVMELDFPLLVVRLERACPKKKFSEPEIKDTESVIREATRDYYKAQFAAIKRKHSKNISIITELTEIFASSIRVRESFKRIIQGVQRYFGFDRVRLYLIDKQAQKLKGEVSVDIRGYVRSISFEEIPLKAGSHRFADIVLGKSSNSFLERYKDCVVYIPMAVQGEVIGLLIADNLLSQERIDDSELAMLKSFAGQIALAVDNVRLFDKVEELSLYDELTKLPLRRYFAIRFQEEFYRAERFKQPLALLWGDIDYFKEINDTYGHEIGDKVLKEVSRVILSSLRKIDFPCRHGGDEILVLLPQASGEDAKKLARRLLSEMGEIKIAVPFSKTGELNISMSIGIAVFPEDASSMEQLLQKADDALYWVKSHGRNNVALYREIITAVDSD